jgi:hypothetical protein
MPNERITALLMASATGDGKVVARYQGRWTRENEVELGEKVDAVERRKDFDASSVSYTTQCSGLWPRVSLASPAPVCIPLTSRTTMKMKMKK